MTLDSQRKRLFETALAKHSEAREVSVSAHAALLYSGVWEAIKGKVIVYLDTRHWIHLRDVRLGRPRHIEDVKIHDSLQRLAAQGRIVCPVSFALFTELTKQTDKATRRATATIMDELGFSVCMLSPSEIAKMELEAFLVEAVLHLSTQHVIRESIWRKPFFMHGDLPVFDIGSDVPGNNLVHKAWLDVLNTFTINETIDWMEGKEAFGSDLPSFPVDEINRLKREYTKQKASWGRIFKVQKLAAIHDNEDMLKQATAQLTNRFPDAVALQDPILLKSVKNLLLECLTDVTWQLRLPCLHVRASLQTAIQMDPKRIVKATDLWDLAHATVGLPYSDVFLFENSFAHLIVTGPLHLNKLYGTQVVAKRHAVLALLETLNG